MKPAKYHLTSVVVRDVLGVPHAFAVVGIKSKRCLSDVKIVLTMEHRMELDRAAKNSGFPDGKDGIAWCTKVFQIRDRRYDGGLEVSVEPSKYFNNGETLAVEVSDMIHRFPSQLTVGGPLNEAPIPGLCWGDVTFIQAVQAAHNLTGKMDDNSRAC
ncbi:MAG: hypothetical protein UY48_C0003G0062 [Candidatus Gottesmanbacteria bacterium GW2011_GWB1_49_7]|uniref:Uncharacterized protein n=1 Tax=Candidatus Gottesmanbacteria bacterium GW2011_GWB1_49_7 TaxID=1618448 RepID=A0A0G1W3U6_9BACT|nr:MAG: hypothetical protein UY48_C0003G0062 [Candidatus Gottesmanbacteria bacterium GW2011_GWB1_49_7]